MCYFAYLFRIGFEECFDDGHDRGRLLIENGV